MYVTSIVNICNFHYYGHSYSFLETAHYNMPKGRVYVCAQPIRESSLEPKLVPQVTSSAALGVQQCNETAL